ncbi:MAG: 50S ribosomal protein L4 [Nanoarchaeota archaeon]|nr:50S ribosomal protein L4 [Nanoarchaeota archaeon]
MKANLYDLKGKKKSQVELPKIFSVRIRPDLVQKYFEADKFIQPYASATSAGLRQSASGTISHKRHDWKGHYGRGISRVPRKTMWRRGTQFMWVGANAPGTTGGRRAHPPKGIGKEKKINKKEVQLAFNSAFAATASKEFILKRYSTIKEFSEAPIIIESLPTKTKELVEMIKTILPDYKNVTFKNKEVRAGKGKARGRKYKSNAGVLIVTSKDEVYTLKGFDVISTEDITISDLYPLGRLTIYTEKSLSELTGENKK